MTVPVTYFRRPAVLAALSLLALAGCATSPQRQTVELAWPEPPLVARIKFVGIVRGTEDVGSRPGRLTQLLAGTPERSRLVQPMGVAVSRDGRRLYVTDYAGHAVFLFDFREHRLSQLTAGGRNFMSPLGIALDGSGNVYVVDSLPRRIVVLDPSGRYSNTITNRALERPTGIAIDPVRGRMYVADSSSRESRNHRVHVFDLDGRYLGAIGTRGRGQGHFFFPTYVACDAAGNLYVTDTLNSRVQVFDAAGDYVRTLGRPGDVPGTFDKPKGVALDTFGNVYVVDSSWSNVQIFNGRGDPLLVFGGRGRSDGFLFNPTGIAIDGENRVYVADAFNGRIGIYQLVNTTAEDSFVTASRPTPR